MAITTRLTTEEFVVRTWPRHTEPVEDDVAGSVLVHGRSGVSAPRFDVGLELGRGEALGSPLLPGFALALDALFAPA